MRIRPSNTGVDLAWNRRDVEGTPTTLHVPARVLRSVQVRCEANQLSARCQPSAAAAALNTAGRSLQWKP